MKLFTNPGACSTADDIALTWAGADIEIEIPEDKQSAAYLALNPVGVVPTLVDGDFVLTQNTAIMGYIADKFPDAGFYGDGSPQQRAEATRWLAFINSDLHPAFKPFFAPGAFTPDESAHDALRASASKRILDLLKIADERLAGREWLAGFRSGCDAYFYVILRWAKMIGVDLTPVPNVSAYGARLEQDAGVLEALKREGLEIAGL